MAAPPEHARPLPVPVFGKRFGDNYTIILSQPNGCSAEIMYYGAQVISWKNARGEEFLFLHRDTVFEEGQPIRGGIPICFPRFFNDESMEEHGFARRQHWSPDFKSRYDPANFPPPPPGNDYADFFLGHTPKDCRNWNHRFRLHLRVILGPTGDLTMIFRVKNLNHLINCNGMPFTFPFSFQNYLNVFDISLITIEGLENRDYLDYKKNRQRFNQGADAFTFNFAVDRLYLNTPNNVTIMDNGHGRTFTISKTDRIPDTVVWNPWDLVESAFEDHALVYRKMVCVEASANEITLNPNEDYVATQHLSVMDWAIPERRSLF